MRWLFCHTFKSQYQKDNKEPPQLGYNIRQMAAERKFCDELSLDVLAQAVPLAEIQAVLRSCMRS